jgi:acyl carrier protein
MATEEEFGIEIPDEQAEALKTVDNLIECVTKRIKVTKGT